MVEIPFNKVGDRILIKQRNGLIPATVRFRGSLEDKNGEWVGIEYDEPYGKHDGSHNGTRYVKGFSSPNDLYQKSFLEKNISRNYQQVVKIKSL